MLIASATRTDLGYLGTRIWTTVRGNALTIPEKDGLVLAWLNEEQTLLPDIIVVQDGQLETFLAWTTTYMPQLCPITALVRVLEYHVAVEELGFTTDRSPTITECEARHLRGCLGIVNAEVVAGYGGTFAPFSAGLTPHLSTLSWLALQVQYLNAKQSMQSVHEAWNETRHLLAAKPLEYSEEIKEIWSVVANSDIDGDAEYRRQVNEIRGFLSAVKEGKPCKNLHKAAQEYTEAIQAVGTGPLEGRVEVFRKLLKALFHKSDAPPLNAVIAGYALSLISQGSFTHIGLLGPDRVLDVRPLLWYGWFDFSREDAEPGLPFIAAANLQLTKCLQQIRTNPRHCDIALEELRILTRLKDPFAECLIDIRCPMSVEVLSGAVVKVQAKVPRGQRNVRNLPVQASLFDE